MKKYYRVKIQEAYDSLMAFLEMQGFKWNSGEKPTEVDAFGIYEENTVVEANEADKSLTFNDTYYSKHVLSVPDFIEWTLELSQSVSAFTAFVIQQMVNATHSSLDNFEAIKKEPVYEIPLSSLETTDGEAQYLSYKDKKWFASRKNTWLKQRFTETELKEKVPEFYRELAKEV